MRLNLKKYIVSIVIYLLWFAAVFDPIGDMFMLRYIALAAAVACLVYFGSYLQLFSREMTIKKSMIIYISFFMPIYGFVLSVIRGGFVSEFLDTSYAAAGILLLFSLIYVNEYFVKVGLRAMLFSLRCLVFLIICIYAAMSMDLNNDWFSFFSERHVAVLSTREYAGISFPYIYFLASPILLYLIGYDLNKLFVNFKIRYVVISFATMFAFAISGTRSHMILAVAYIPIFYIFVYSRHKLFLIFFCMVSVAAILNLFDIEILRSFFSANESNNAMKIDLLDNYAEIFDSPLTFMFGQGYNAHTWSVTLRKMVALEVHASKTELTYIELVRVYGIFIAIPFYFLLAALIYRLARTSDEYKWLYPAFLIYLLDSSLNPYLFSTNGMLPLGLIVAIVSLKGLSTRPELTAEFGQRGLDLARGKHNS
jgi:hypothetical protein